MQLDHILKNLNIDSFHQGRGKVIVCVCVGGGGLLTISFIEYGHVAYQIKGISSCRNMVVIILSAYPGGGVKRSKFNIFRKWSCCLSNQMESRKHQHVRKLVIKCLEDND